MSFSKDESQQASGRTPSENNDLARLRELFIEGDSLSLPTWNYQLLTYLRRHSLAKILFWEHLYKQILNIPGVIMEFGVHYGTSMSTLISMRGLFEPYNFQREVIGFDTFDGFASIEEEDKNSKIEWTKGDYSTHKGFVDQLTEVLEIQERMSPLSHVKKFDLVVGDASETFPKWLSDNPEQIIALMILDMDVYKPTKDVLEAAQNRLTKGSIVVLDELSSRVFPGETKAFLEVIGARSVSLRRFPLQPTAAYYVVE
jgi:Macrocin-O-methyltransferase (TylF)